MGEAATESPAVAAEALPPDPRVRHAQRLVVATIVAAIGVGLTGIVLGPCCYLLMLPLMTGGQGLLGSFAAWIGGWCLGMVLAGLRCWRGCLTGSADLPAALAQVARMSALAGVPAMLWQIALAWYALDGGMFYDYGWIAAEGTAIVSLSWPVFVLAVVARSRVRRSLPFAEGPVAGRLGEAVHRVAQRGLKAVVPMVLVLAWAWPAPPRFHGQGPWHEGTRIGDWVERWRDRDGLAEQALVRAGAPAVPFVLVAGEGESGLRWLIADWLGFVFGLADNVAPLLGPVGVVPPLELERFECIQRMGRDAGPAVPEILAVLPGIPLGLRSPACRALGAIGPAAVAAAPELRRFMGEAAGMERVHAAVALAAVSRDGAGEVLPLFLAGLRATDPLGRYVSLQGLAMLGPRAASAVPEILPLLLTAPPNVYLHQAAVQALAAIEPGSDRVVSALLAVLPTSPSPGSIVQALARSTGHDGEVVPALAALLADPRTRARASAASGLNNLGPRARGAVSALVTACADGDRGVRINAAIALRELRVDEPAVVAALESLLGDPPAALAAAASLARLGHPTPAVVAVLERSLADRRTPPTLWALSECGAAAASALSALRRVRGAADDAEIQKVISAIEAAVAAEAAAKAPAGR